MNSMPPVIAEYIEGLRTHDVEKIGGTVWDDMVFVSTARALGKREFLHFLRCLYIAFPDWHYEHDPPEWREDEISIKWRQGGTHQAVFAMPGIAPVAATHRLVKLPEQFFFYRLRRDKISEIRPEPIPGERQAGYSDRSASRCRSCRPRRSLHALRHPPHGFKAVRAH